MTRSPEQLDVNFSKMMLLLHYLSVTFLGNLCGIRMYKRTEKREFFTQASVDPGLIQVCSNGCFIKSMVVHQ